MAKSQSNLGWRVGLHSDYESGDANSRGRGNGSGTSQARTLTEVREAQPDGMVQMPRGPYREVLGRGRFRDVWTLEQRAPLCVQKLRLVGIGVPPPEVPRAAVRQWSLPPERGRMLLNRKHVAQVPRAHSTRRAAPQEKVGEPSALPATKGRLSFRFSRWADQVDDDQPLGLVSYAESSGDSSEEEGVNVRLLHQAMKNGVDSNRTAKGGKVPPGGSCGSNAENKGSNTGGVARREGVIA